MSTLAREPAGEIPLELKPDLDLDLVEEFVSDAREQLENIEQGALALEQHGHDPEGIHTLFRAFHTLKGNAGFLDLTAVSSLAHLLESLLAAARENRLKIDSSIIELILQGRDTIQRFVDEIEAQTKGGKPRQIVHLPTAALKASIKHKLDGPAQPGTPAPPAALENNSSGEQEGRAQAGAAHASDGMPGAVKVSTAKLDGLVDLTGELLITQSLLAQSLTSPNVSRHTLARNLDQLTRLSKELQRTAMSLRMVPIRSTLHKMQRLARDLAARQDKSVQLELEGEDTEVDRTVVEKLGDPLMHMISNAIDHGIEKPETRAASGKPATGRIAIRAYHKSGNIVLEVSDDGAGLDRERIREKALQQRLLQPDDAVDDQALFGMILQPGFSTAAVVTNISGRGVGLDVVHRNVSKLRGKIEIQSVAGQGTTFLLRLPLTLAVIDGLILGVGGQRYIVPTLSVRESFDARACRVTSLPGGREMVEIRREMIPLLRLRDHFQLKGLPSSVGEGILIVIEADGKKRCLWADELVGKQEVVIKNLGEVFRTDPMVSGGAILGNGTVGLILDPGALVHLEPGTQHLQLAI